MDRRTFVKGTFGLVMLAAAGGTSMLATTGCSSPADAAPYFTTPAIGEPETATGPLMMAGIDLVEIPGGRVSAYFENTELFTVDPAGAALVSLADGKRTIDAIAAEAGALGYPCAPVDVALFFSTLGQAGYLRNRVLVSIMDREA